MMCESCPCFLTIREGMRGRLRVVLLGISSAFDTMTPTYLPRSLSVILQGAIRKKNQSTKGKKRISQTRKHYEYVHVIKL